MARKSCIDKWEEEGSIETILATVRGMALHGCSREVISEAIGISVKTLERLLNKKEKGYDERFVEAIREGNTQLYYSCISKQVEWLNDETIDINVRIALAQKFEKQYRHRFMSEVDKEYELSKKIKKEEKKANSVQRVFVLKGKGDSDGC